VTVWGVEGGTAAYVAYFHTREIVCGVRVAAFLLVTLGFPFLAIP